MYSILAYGQMISDEVRLHAYSEALRQTLKPGSTVLDIGTGPGIMALLACKFGARKVYAIEPASIVHVAKEIAAANGFAGRIEFFEAMSTDVALPERVDVIVSDVGGILPWFQQHMSTIMDARQRFLKDGGVLIPKRHTIWMGVIESEWAYAEHWQAWESEHGFDMRAARELAVNRQKKVRIAAESLLAPAQRGAVLNYNTLDNKDSKADARFVVSRSGIGHGLLVWTDYVLTDEISFSNGPGCKTTLYGQTFFPWLRPVALDVGDIINCTLRCNLVGDEYLYTWSAKILEPANQLKVKAAFQQSDFSSFPISPASLRKGAENYVPRTNGNASIDAFVLNSMDGKTRVGDIAARLAKMYPKHFKTPSAALDRVARLSRAYSE